MGAFRADAMERRFIARSKAVAFAAGKPMRGNRCLACLPRCIECGAFAMRVREQDAGMKVPFQIAHVNIKTLTGAIAVVLCNILKDNGLQ